MRKQMKMKQVNAVTAAIALLVMTAMVLSVGSARAGFVTIGDPGNDDDPGGSGHGKVDYTYQIAETTTTGDDYYNAGYGGTEDDFYAVNGPTLYEAMDYANTLTENYHGNSNYNMYDVDVENNTASYNYTRQEAVDTGKKIYAVPTRDEWYKAAYYNVDEGVYYDWANAMNKGDADAPPPEGSDGSTGEGWNYVPSDGGTDISFQELPFSPEEQNGTYDMMGNTTEWTEAGDHAGGRHGYDEDRISSSDYPTFNKDADNTWSDNSFRVVAIPEPGSAALLVLAAGLLLGSRRRVRA